MYIVWTDFTFGPQKLFRYGAKSGFVQKLNS